MKLRRLALIALFLIAGCKTTNTPVLPDNHQSTVLGAQATEARSKVNNQIAGDAVGAQKALAPLPESRNKEVANKFLDDIVAVTGGATLETKTSFEKLADQLISEDAKTRANAEVQWSKVAADNEALKAKVAKLEADHQAALEKEHSDAEARLKAVVQQARLDAEARERKFITWIFMGGGAALLAAAALVLFIMGSNPMFGPKVAMGLGAAGALSIGTGIAILQLLSHPNVIWWGLGIIVAALAVTAGLMISNQHHALEAKP